MIFWRMFNEHLENLREMFQRLREANLCLKPKKCHLAEQQVLYLGYVVSEAGISVDTSKVEAIEKFPIPRNVKELRLFLGLASYYRCFIAGFSKIAHPLFALTKKGAMFQWNSSCQQAFGKLKDMLTSAPVLVFPDFRERFILKTDVSGLGLGAILSQRQPNGLIAPIAYASHTLKLDMGYQN